MVLGLVFLSLPVGLIAAGVFLLVAANAPERHPSPGGTVGSRVPLRSEARR